MGLDEIATFIEAVDHGSLTRAAAALGVPKSTVSRRLARLEEDLGQQLVQRHSRLFRLTEAGQDLFHRTEAAVRDLQDATARARDASTTLRGSLRLTMAPDMILAPRLVQTLADFRAEHPEVDVAIEVTDRMVDLVAEGIDCALRAHGKPLQDSSVLRMRRLVTTEVGLFASPRYLDRRGRPQEPGDLGAHCFISPTSAPGSDQLRLTRGDETVTVTVHAPLRANSMAFLPVAAAAGAGITLVPGFRTPTGLERVLPQWSLPPATVSLVWPMSRVASPRRRAFLDFAIARLGTTDAWMQI